MADTKISALDAIASVAAADLIAVVDDVSGTPKTTKATITQLLAFIDANVTVTESQISDLGSYITDVSGDNLSALADVTITGIASGEILKWNGSAWINNTLAEAGISATSHTHLEADITDLQSYLLDVTGSALDNTKIWIGSVGNVAAEFALSGDATMTAGGVVTVVDDSHAHTNSTITLSSLDLSDTADLTYNADTDVSGNIWVLDEDTLVSDSNTKLATQQSIKAYVDAQVGGIDTIAELTDVTITDNSDGEVLRWNGSAWINNTLAELGASATGHTHTESDITDLGTYLTDITGEVINDLSDVVITGTPADNEVLAYNTGTSKWINQTASEAGLASSSHTHVEADITDLGSYITASSTDTLTNKTITLPQINDTSADHQYIFGVSELTLDRTVTLPLLTGNDTFTFDAHTSTLTNKTINTASNTITVVEADISDLGSYITASSVDTLTNKTFDANGTGNSISNIDIADHSATGTPDATTFYRGDNTWAVPAGSGDMVLASAQTNSGIKTFLDTTMKLRNVANTFDGYFVNTNTADRIYTLQDSSDTLVGRDTTDTLTNKTINTASNTITVVEADISDLGSYITASSADTLTNKSIDAGQLTGIIADARMPDLTGDITTSEGTVSTTISAKAVDIAMLADGTDGELITWDAAGVATTVLTGSSGQVLTSNGVGTAPTFQAAGAADNLGDHTATEDLQLAGFNIDKVNSIYLTEQAAADADITGDGQIWVNSTGNVLTYTNEGGTDTAISLVGHAHTESDISDLGTTVAMVADNLSVFANTTKAQLEGIMSDVANFAEADGDVYSGTHDFTGGRFLITTSATPTMSSDGDMAIDTTVTDFSHGVLKFYDGEEVGVVSMPIAQFTTPGDGEVIAYNATNDEFELVAAGAGDALVANPLSQFAATTSAQLAGVLSDETGSGLLVFGTSPTIVTPTIASLTNAQHDHTNAAGGGQIAASTALSDYANLALVAGDVYTGTHDFGGADDLEIPNSATPTVDTAGQIALDTSITDHTPLIKYHDGTEEFTVIAIPDDQRTTTDGHVIAYNATDNEFEMVAQSGGGLSNVVEDTSPELGGNLDVNGFALTGPTVNLELIKFGETASAVNEITVTNAATAGSPSITATGDDTDIDLTLDGKGTGTVKTLSSNLDVTGNIVVSGTVDGIDIATDVAANTAKVSNATHTGDVTGSTALTIAAGAVDDTMINSTDDVMKATISFVIDGGGSAITTGVKGFLEVPFNCTIDQATLLADQTGSIVVDIWKDSYANYPPTDADSITASAVPTISSGTKDQDATLTGWTTSITAGDIIGFNVDSITTCQRVTVSLEVHKT